MVKHIWQVIPTYPRILTSLVVLMLIGAPLRPGPVLAHRLAPASVVRQHMVLRYTASNVSRPVVDQRLTQRPKLLNGRVAGAKRVVVSLSQQKLWAFTGARLILTTLVTTGNRALPTPVGTFYILARYSPFTFVSPWPAGSPYYYPPSTAHYALLFDDRGYFVHDAPWRRRFGPGSNAAWGTPGQDSTGTHGCINVPAAPMRRLYGWASLGTVVQIEP